MKATGVVRRIDELGRIVIPKEIRRTLMIKEGDPLEIYRGPEGEILLKKYSPLGQVVHLAENCAGILASQMKAAVCISDKEKVLATAGRSKVADGVDGEEMRIKIISDGDTVGIITVKREGTEGFTVSEKALADGFAKLLGRQLEI
ncbi:MAG: AbrB/MazE/SpoVT family DNA-binding domain-containing protein [Lachnospiraceae bacterium]|nr:AbrB/MazE/SpoVT family DNA-binding domain-containing protein [Lachnospiraceae bacterium]